MPEEYEIYGGLWSAMNPDWTLVDWTEDAVLEMGLVNQKVWDDLAVPLTDSHVIHPVALATQRADVAAYEIMFRHGGLYLNTDIEPIRPLEVLFDNNFQLASTCGAGWEVPGQWVVNAVLWAPRPWMDFYRNVIRSLPASYYNNPGGYMNGTTGPHLITSEYRKNEELLHVFEKDTFNPYGFVDVPVGGVLDYNRNELPAVTIGVHKWGHRTNGRPQTASWIPGV